MKREVYPKAGQADHITFLGSLGGKRMRAGGKFGEAAPCPGAVPCQPEALDFVYRLGRCLLMIKASARTIHHRSSTKLEIRMIRTCADTRSTYPLQHGFNPLALLNNV